MTVDHFLRSYTNTKIYYKPNPGNGGDALIAHSAYSLFKKHNIRFQFVNQDDDLSGKTVFYAGGGNLVEYYHHCADFLKKHHKSAKEIVILPHTVNGHKELLSELGKNVIIFCREQKSYDYTVQFQNLKSVYLDDDLVVKHFPIEDFRSPRPSSRLLFLMKPRHILAAIYKGREKPGFFFKKRATSQVLNAYRNDVEGTNIVLPDDNLDITALINLDMSMANETMVEETCARVLGFLNLFSLINTNRLHVSIAAALIGKKVNLYDNAYHKNRSIHAYSLKEKFPNVTFVEGQNNQ